MYRLKCLLLCFLAHYAVEASVSFINPCKPDDIACHKANVIVASPHFVAGIPELGLPPADPIVLDDVRSDDKNLKLGLRNLKVTGIKDCELVDFTRDLEKSTMKLIEECPVTATGQYDLNGKILFIPAEGDGDFSIETDKAKIEVTIKYKVIEKSGAKHWKITSFDFNYDILGKPSINFHNLYGGDETRAKPIRDILEKSSTELIKELGGPIIKELLTKEVEIINKFFWAVPITELEIS